MKRLLVLFFWLVLPLGNPYAQEDFQFNLEHVRGAIRYFEEDNRSLINNLALTEASRYISNHSQAYDHDLKGIPILNQTRLLLENNKKNSTLDEVKARVSEIENKRPFQANCFQTVSSFFPDSIQINPILYLTWGYELETSLPEGASINIANNFFNNFPEEVWTKCSILIAKSSLKKAFPAPLPNDKTTLLAFIQNKIFIEGIGEFLGFSSGSNNKMQTYTNFLSNLDKISNLEELKGYYLNHDDWDDVGQHMAYSIASVLGEKALKETIKGGSQSFFEAFEKTKLN